MKRCLLQLTAVLFFSGQGFAQNVLPTNGNVGIGTTNPSHILTIQKDNDWLQLDKSSTSTYSGITNSVAGTNKWFLGLREVGNSGNATNRYSFYNFTTGSEPMVIQENGNVGIGTTSPSAYFHGGTNNVLEISNPGTAANSQAQLILSTGATNNVGGVGGVTWVTRNSTGNPGLAYIGALLSNDSTANAYGRLVFATANGSTPVQNMVLDNVGNVGIGTMSPAVKLHVAGSVKISGSGASMTFPDNTVQATAWNGTTCGGDYAESVDVSGDRSSYEPGDVLVIDTNTSGNFLRAAKPYSKLVAGIYSTKPGLTGRRQGAPVTGEEVPMAMLGIVPTKVSTENGSIEPGDLLVTSSTPGYAMKGTDAGKMMGAVIGKAIGHLNEGKGVVEALVSLQ